jgi:thiol-disulfide isomerase/thioredoxin
VNEPTPSESPTARQTPPAQGPLLPGRIGLVLAQPMDGLRLYEARGGGVRDAGYLVLLGLLCFRLEDLTRMVLGITHLSPGTVLRDILRVLSDEVRVAILVVIFASLAVVLGAGRGKRDPSRDLELGAAAFIPFFTVRAAFCLLYPEARGPVVLSLNPVTVGVSVLWGAMIVVLSVLIARRRAPASADPAVGPTGPDDEQVPQPGLSSRLAVTALALVAGAGFGANVAFVARNADAIRPLSRGKEAPDFVLPRLDAQGGTLALASLKGKVVLLDFWAKWCGPCVNMMPTLHGIQQDWHGRGVQLVGVHGPSVPEDEVRAFLRERPTGYPMLMDAEGRVNDLYKVVALPHLVLVGRDGAVLKTFWGVTSRSEIEDVLAAAVEVPAP